MIKAFHIIVLLGIVMCQYKIIEHPSDRKVWYYDINDNGIVDKEDQLVPEVGKEKGVPIIVRKKQKVVEAAPVVPTHSTTNFNTFTTHVTSHTISPAAPAPQPTAQQPILPQQPDFSMSMAQTDTPPFEQFMGGFNYV